MADIDIQKKKSPVWPWILGIIIAALAIWLIIKYTHKDGQDTAVVNPADTTAENDTQPDVVVNTVFLTMRQDTSVSGPIQRYISWARSTADADKMGEPHAYTAQGLQALSKALGALAAKAYAAEQPVTQTQDTLKQMADAIQKDASSMKHADKVHTAFVAASQELQHIQQKDFSQMRNETDALMKDANAVDGNKPLLAQKDAVRAYFGQAADVLDKMRNANNQ